MEDSADYGDLDQEDLMEDTGSDRPLAVQPDMSHAPSENEVRLGRKVHQLEKERDELAAELKDLRARCPNDSTTIPASPPPTQTTPAKLTIPHELLPTFALLRSHIDHLTRDNDALRYTFLGTSPLQTPSPAIATSSKITLDVAMTPGRSSDTLSPSTTITGSQSMDKPQLSSHIDLNAVVSRVKELLKENEELGEMVVEAGRGGNAEWEKALEESKAVISSLDTDLTHHLSVIQSIQKDLNSYRNHFGPLPVGSAAPVSAAAGSVVRKEASQRDRPGHSRSYSHTSSRRDDNRNSSNPADPPKDRDRDRDRDKESRGEGVGSSRRGHDRNESRGGGNGGGRGGLNGSKETRKEDDRAWKRRR